MGVIDHLRSLGEERLVALLAERRASGPARVAEVGVFSSMGRSGTQVVGTVALLTRTAVVLGDAAGRKKTLPLDSILSIWEES